MACPVGAGLLVWVVDVEGTLSVPAANVGPVLPIDVDTEQLVPKSGRLRAQRPETLACSLKKTQPPKLGSIAVSAEDRKLHATRRSASPAGV